MQKFIIRAIESGIKGNPNARCLNHDTTAFCHSEYHGGRERHKIDGTIENLICTFKNDITPYPQHILNSCMCRLETILKTDLPIILNHLGCSTLRVCVIPRAKNENHYTDDQKLFRQTIKNTVNSLYGFEDGTLDIIRHSDTLTTHLARCGGGGNGSEPYPGITRDTCNISNQVWGKDILLIDDLYTKTVGIDEDAIQALIDSGANNVYFYAIGRTV